MIHRKYTIYIKVEFESVFKQEPTDLETSVVIKSGIQERVAKMEVDIVDARYVDSTINKVDDIFEKGN